MTRDTSRDTSRESLATRAGIIARHASHGDHLLADARRTGTLDSVPSVAQSEPIPRHVNDIYENLLPLR